MVSEIPRVSVFGYFPLPTFSYKKSIVHICVQYVAYILPLFANIILYLHTHHLYVQTYINIKCKVDYYNII